MNFVVAQHGMSHAFKVVSGAAILKADVHHTGPVPLLQKLDHATGQGFIPALSHAFIFDQFSERPSDDFLEGLAEQLGEHAMRRADLAVEAESQKESSKESMRSRKPCCDLEIIWNKLIELAVAGQTGFLLIEAANQLLVRRSPQFSSRYTRRTAPPERTKADAIRQGLHTPIRRFASCPRQTSKHDGDNEEEEEGETPQFGLALLEFFQASFCPGARISLLRSSGIAGRIVLAVHEF